jgi:hypothetical protein
MIKTFFGSFQLKRKKTVGIKTEISNAQTIEKQGSRKLD